MRLICHHFLNRSMQLLHNVVVSLAYWHVDPHPIHRPTRLAILKVKGKVGFRVLKNLSQWGTVLFGVVTYFLFLFLFLNGENLSKNKNPSMTPVRKRRSRKTRFWVRGPRPGTRSLLMNWVYGSIWVKDQTNLGLKKWHESYRPA